jgi:hypothetical protein
MRRPIVVFAISAIVVLTAESLYGVQRGQGSGPQVQPPSQATPKRRTPAGVDEAREVGPGVRAAAVKPVPAKTVKRNGSVAKLPTLSPVQRKLQRNPGLAAKIGGRLPPGTNLMAAASGFRTVGQFASAVNGSNTSRIPFAELKRRMAYDGMTLGQAFQDLRPKSDYRSQAQRAEIEAAALVGTEEVEPPPMLRAQRARR